MTLFRFYDNNKYRKWTNIVENKRFESSPILAKIAK